MNITISSNLPGIRVTLMDGHCQPVREVEIGSDDAIPYIEEGGPHEGTRCKTTSRTSIVKFTNLKKGIYTLKICLPYYMCKELYEMPVVMNKTIWLRNKSVKLKFNATIK